MWGQADVLVAVGCKPGIIPTRVGTSRTKKSSDFRAQDHPHACGDKSVRVDVLSSVTGSSPRVWGQEPTSANGNSKAGIIPTRVGTSSERIRIILIGKDHPHACGDKFPKSFKVELFGGSSPRVWGQAIIVKQKMRAYGIIPTRVGTSQAMREVTYRVKDHPHACGDKVSNSVICVDISGSSPRVWGQAVFFRDEVLGYRIIPTRVGTSNRVALPRFKYEDHPHACGDKVSAPLSL